MTLRRTVQLATLLCGLVVTALPLQAQSQTGEAPSPVNDDTPETDLDRLEALRRVSSALSRESGLSAELREALQDLMGVLERETLSPGTSVADDLRRLTVRANEHERVVGPLSRVVETLNVYGDLRLRHETDLDRDDAPTRNRERLRMRLGANVAVSEELVAGVRLVTGDSRDPQSPHQTFGGGFDNKEISIDRAYLDYHPAGYPGLWVRGGKFGHAFRPNPVYSELVWDSDVQPEGVAVGYRARDTAGWQRIDLVVGEYIITEQGAGDEASAFVAQISGETALAQNWDLAAALGYSRFSRLSPDGSTAVTANNNGNALAANGDFASRFSLLNPIVSVTNTSLDKPLTFSGEYISNTRARGPYGTGWALGTAYGATRDADDWRLYYQYQNIEQDAVLTPFAQDDFLRMTHFRGHVAGWQYQLETNVQVHLWGLLTTAKTGIPTPATERNQQWRLRLDINIKF